MIRRPKPPLKTSHHLWAFGYLKEVRVLWSFKEGSLPAVITEQGAWAGETFCLFKKLKRTRTDWKAVASCSDSNEDWTTDVQLSVKANRLIWKSKRDSVLFKMLFRYFGGCEPVTASHLSTIEINPARDEPTKAP